MSQTIVVWHLIVLIHSHLATKIVTYAMYLDRVEYQTEGDVIQLYLLGRSASVIILLQ